MEGMQFTPTNKRDYSLTILHRGIHINANLNMVKQIITQLGNTKFSEGFNLKASSIYS